MYFEKMLAGVSDVVEVAAADARVPAGAFGAIHGATFALQRQSASEHLIKLTEDVSVAMLRLEWAIRRKDSDAIERARILLRELRCALADDDAAQVQCVTSDG